MHDILEKFLHTPLSPALPILFPQIPLKPSAITTTRA